MAHCSASVATGHHESMLHNLAQASQPSVGLVQVLKDEVDAGNVVAALAAHGPIAWCKELSDRRFLVRFTDEASLQAAINAYSKSFDASDAHLQVSRAPLGSEPLLPAMPSLDADCSNTKGHATTAMSLPSVSVAAALPEQSLRYYDRLVNDDDHEGVPETSASSTENHRPQITVIAASGQLRACAPEWEPAQLLSDAASLSTAPAMEQTDGSGALSFEEDSLQSSGSLQLWRQRSIGAAARKDLAKVAALQSFVHLRSSSGGGSDAATPHSCMSACGGSLLGGGGLTLSSCSSPWGSFTAGHAVNSGSNLADVASVLATLAPGVTSSRDLTMSSSQVDSPITCGGGGGTTASATWQRHELGTGCSGCGGVLLPNDLGLGDGDCYSEGDNGGSSSMDGTAPCTLSAAGCLPQQLLMRRQPPSLALPHLPAPPPLQLPHHEWEVTDCLHQQHHQRTLSGGRFHGVPGTGQQPPPPQPEQRSSTACAGSTKGMPTISWSSPHASPRSAGTAQCQSPVNTCSGRPPRAGTRLFHAGNAGTALSHHHQLPGQSVPPPPCQPPTSGATAQQRCNSPAGLYVYAQAHSIPPGYVAACAAAAAACDVPYPLDSPAGLRQVGSGLGTMPSNTQLPCSPAQLLVQSALVDAASSGSPRGMTNSNRPGTPRGGTVSRVPAFPAQASARLALGQAQAQQSSKVQAVAATHALELASQLAPVAPLRADGALFLQEMLALLHNTCGSGHPLLTNLKELLQCALAVTSCSDATTTNVHGMGSQPGDASKVPERKPLTGDGSTTVSSRVVGHAALTPVPVDAAAFLGLLVEAAEPLLNAAAESGRRGRRGAGRGPAAINCGGDAGTAPGSNRLLRALAGHESMAGGEAGMPLRDGYTASPAAPSVDSPRGANAMLPTPQPATEIAACRAALHRMLLAAHAFIHSPSCTSLASALEAIGRLYDSMHDDPVVVKRRKCAEMADTRRAILQDPTIVKTVAVLSSLRTRVHSLSRRLLVGLGQADALPLDLLIGGVGPELALALGGGAGNAATAPWPMGSATAAAPEAHAAKPVQASACSHSSSVLHSAGVLEFFTSSLPLPHLALLVFAEFVPVDAAAAGRPTLLNATEAELVALSHESVLHAGKEAGWTDDNANDAGPELKEPQEGA